MNSSQGNISMGNASADNVSRPEILRANIARYKYLPISEAFIAGLGLIMNCIVLVRLLYLRVGRGVTLKAFLQFVLNLAVCDALVALIHLVIWPARVPTLWTMILDMDVNFTPLTCSIGTLYLLVQNISLLTMLFLAIDIVVLVKNPIKYSLIMTPEKGSKLILITWLACSVFWVAVTATFWLTMSPVLLAIIAIFNIIPSAIGFVVFVVIYVIVFYEIGRFVLRTPSRQSRHVVKSAVTVGFILVTYVISMMPFIWLIISVVTKNNVLLVLYAVKFLFVMNTVWDPLIYMTRVKELRTLFLSIPRYIKCNP